MKIPKKIILFGEEFEIKKLSKEEIECKTCKDGATGLCKFDEKEIHIAIDDKENTELELLLHELGHYFGKYVDGGESEAFANMFSKYVYTLLGQLNIDTEEK